MGKYPQYSDDFRAGAILMLEAAGYPNRSGSLAYASKKLGVAGTTLARWFNAKNNPPPPELVREKRFDLRQAVRGELANIFDAMGAVRPDASYKDLAWSAGVLIDKMQLIDGLPTWRVEVVDLLRSGSVTPRDVLEELGSDLAAELFGAAGLAIDATATSTAITED